MNETIKISSRISFSLYITINKFCWSFEIFIITQIKYLLLFRIVAMIGTNGTVPPDAYIYIYISDSVMPPSNKLEKCKQGHTSIVIK